MPEIFNTDQDCQFTSAEFTQPLLAHDVRLSMDGKGWCMDNVFVERLWRSLKHEEVYLKRYERWWTPISKSMPTSPSTTTTARTPPTDTRPQAKSTTTVIEPNRHLTVALEGRKGAALRFQHILNRRLRQPFARFIPLQKSLRLPRPSAELLDIT